MLIRLTVALALALVGIGPAWPGSLPFCVTTSAQLQNALASADSNGQSDVIRIAAGTYVVPPGGFKFSAVSPNEANRDLELSGGWTFFQGNSCGQRISSDPEITVLDGGGSEQILDVILPANGDLTISQLTFANGSTTASGGGLDISLPQGRVYSGTVRVNNNIFLNNDAEVAGGLAVNVTAAAATVNVQILNNLFLLNSASIQSAAAQIAVVMAPGTAGEIIINPLPAVTLAHNTIENNTSPTVGGVWLLGDVTNLWVASNNLWANSGTDLRLGWPSSFSDTIRVRNNNIQDFFSQSPPDEFTGNISVAPIYVSCGLFCLDRVPIEGSPLIDAGFQPFIFFQPWSLPAVDLDGRPRLVNEAVDIGAWEGRAWLFRDRFEQD